MPLRHHFRPPVDSRHSWDELFGMWPAVMVQSLFGKLPEGYAAAPNVHIGAFEVDVATHEESEFSFANHGSDGGVATALWTAPAPTLTLETDLPEQDEYEVRIYDQQRGRTLVAAVEIVSPRNKDRPESRRAFVAKLAALLQRDVCVSIVDLVTVRQDNLYANLLELLGEADPNLGETPPILYAATVRRRTRPGKRPMLEGWFYPLALGQALPTLPIWLDARRAVALELEATYEDSCRVLRIR